MLKVKEEFLVGDCLKIMQGLPSDSIDLILTDPPYATSSDRIYTRSGVIPLKMNMDHNSEFKWDSWDSHEEFRDWLFVRVAEMVRLLRKGGSLLIYTADYHLSFLIQFLMKYGMKYRGTVLHIITNPTPRFQTNGYIQSLAGYVAYATKGTINLTFNYEKGKFHEFKNIMESAIVSGKERLKDSENNTLHRTQKPLKVMRKLIKIHSNPGDLVLDPFAGVCTVAKMAKLLNRRFLVIDLENKFIEAGKRWVYGRSNSFLC